ncbi:MAG: alpha/beta hydrolase family protein [Amphiamblys sp. WSBS2006]|nr:MAG: alpha/beta hydrolase family protein [Amphiamblys sp. WSBS2006]
MYFLKTVLLKMFYGGRLLDRRVSTHVFLGEIKDVFVTAADGAKTVSHIFTPEKCVNRSDVIILLKGRDGTTESWKIFGGETADKLKTTVCLVGCRGYCLDTSVIPSKKGILMDVKSSVKEIKKLFPGKVFLFGQSIGCAVALEIIQQESFDGVVLEDPFISLSECLLEHGKGFLKIPMRIIGETWDNVKEIKKGLKKNKDIPFLVISALEDIVVPHRHRMELMKVFTKNGYTRVRRHETEGANHLESYRKIEYWGALTAFLLENSLMLKLQDPKIILSPIQWESNYKL